MSTTERNLVNYHCVKCGGLLIQSHSRKKGSICVECFEPSLLMLPQEIKRRHHAIVSLGLVDAQNNHDGTWTIPSVSGRWVLVKRLTREVTSRKGLEKGQEYALDGNVILLLRPQDDEQRMVSGSI